MQSKIEDIRNKIKDLKAESTKDIEDLRILLLGKKGKITQLFSEFRNVPNDQKKELGQHINNLKNAALEKMQQLKDTLEGSKIEKSDIDVTLPPFPLNFGSRHPISLVLEELYNIFGSLGFKIVEGPEIEDDWHVFSSLNFPEEHPARDMQDTFFIESKPDIVLRTHTSSVQVRTMEQQKPPIRVICPGRVFGMKQSLQERIAFSIR